MLFPCSVIEERDGNFPDAEAVARVHSKPFNAWVTTLPTLSLAKPRVDPAATIAGLTPQRQDVETSKAVSPLRSVTALQGLRREAPPRFRVALASPGPSV